MNRIFHYLVLYSVILVSGGLIYAVHKDIIIITLLVFCFLVILLGKVRIDRRFFYLFALVSMLLLFTSIYTNGSLSIQTVFNYLLRFLLAYVAYKWDKERAYERVIKLILCLSIFSLIGFLFTGILGVKLPGFLFFSSQEYPAYHFNIFYAYAENYHSGRNIGIFNEPGVYQTILNFALMIMFFRPPMSMINIRSKVIVVLVVTIISTFSTTGYINMAVIILFYVLTNRKKDTASKRLKIISIISSIAFIFYINFASESSSIFHTIISKISEDGQINFGASTGLARIESMKADTKIALLHPFGLGYTEYSRVWKSFVEVNIIDTSSVSGITIAMATIGIHTTLLIYGYVAISFLNNNKNPFEFIVFVFVLIFNGLSQPGLIFPLYIMYAISRKSTGDMRIKRPQTNKGTIEVY
ncbi:hypothetical protein [Bacillus sp. OTU530]|uniref:hypothetical protein n=1 Tax=Bacillus sp. OTU530 TaxID=3043862 RepID=UPI00313AF8FC